jgi:hypothetical protein
MKTIRVQQYAVGLLLGLAMFAWLGHAPDALAETQETFDVLQAGTHTYKNVTVTSKSKDYIFIVHSEGMSNVKFTDLAPEIRAKLGYVEPEKPKPQTNSAALVLKQTLVKIDNAPQVQQVKAQIIQTWSSDRAEKVREWFRSLKPGMIYGGVAALILLYVFFCYCCSLICQKAGKPPGPLVWIPVLSVFPMMRAADMSGWWFLACLVPGLNLLAVIIWAFKIARARGKTAFVGLLLLLPPISFLVFLYLAFSDGAGKKRTRLAPVPMGLETA